ncbi:hypothetical protein GGI19_005960 [Coemansia pectinata]|uniref:Uncharacterized protein n=1 Tax=Coemansia pectinata TaxID=1052879 RepID=A0A9W8GTA6_9FUNG|nr:hypothetical protein GGI19_005960 [Coemansia pectinata]
MDIDDDNSSAGTLHNEGQNIARSNSTTSTRRTVTFNIDQNTSIPEETMPVNRITAEVSEDGSEQSSSAQQLEETSPHMTLSYSPLGMASSTWTATGHTAFSYAPTVHSLLPDAHGICHYHRPSFTPHREGMLALPRSLIARGMELRHRESVLASNLDFAHRESMVRLEASQRALEQVLLSMGIGPRDDVKGKMPDLLSLADNDVQEQGSSSEGESSKVEVQDEDKQIEDLLEKFSLLLGDDGSTETRDNS